MSDQNKKTAVILFNLGGPDSEEAIKPFLFNLFYDKNIITLPNPFRWMIAKLISGRREKEAKEIYSHLGGKSPIFQETKEQADKLQTALDNEHPGNFKVFICMRHWHPMSDEVIREVRECSADQIVFLPLYPQFSTTTSGSSFEEFKEKMAKFGLDIPVKTICCYPTENNFIKAHARLILDKIKEIKKDRKFRVLFSAHGLPEKTIKSGDPYQMQVEKTVEAVVKEMKYKDLDYLVTYQSRVGPLKWIDPNTEDEIKITAKEGLDLVIVPIAFVSEHSETLVELDIEYKELVEDFDIDYYRVKTLSSDKGYVDSLKSLTLKAVYQEGGFIGAHDLKRFCSMEHCKCLAK